ncbi:hypothetical protein ASZ78_002208 [Callipepla squamata]|uniref:ATPase AAA-type core domain-containing protein n=1 Tax=Callipepla squamata TaxID=9009 RepID=A0A226NM48_CALSU|nr:hypothetical protein ASZ78_002208 [Callipepla squamata]
MESPGDEDDFAERFAAELEVLAELGDYPSPPGPKVSQLRSRKQPRDESSPAPGPNARKRSQDCALHASPLPSPPAEFPEAITPKPKRQRLEAVKKLNFGGDSELACDVLQGTATLVPGSASPCGPLAARSLAFSSPELEVSGLKPLQSSPPTENPKRVLKRPPVLGDYINVTSSEGTRVYMAMRDDPFQTGLELCDSVGRNMYRPLHLLGVPFSYLKEQAYEEHRRRALEASQQLTETVNSCLESSHGAMEQPGDTGEEESASHCLWVDKFTPRRYVELLSDDYTNRCLLKWLKLWDTVVFGREKPVKKTKPSAEAHPRFRQPKEQQNKWKTKVQLTEEILEAELDQHKRPKYKVALLCGPPGLGKTTLAHVIARHAGYNVVEMNASDDRSPEIFKTRIEAATQMKSVLGAEEKPNCLTMKIGLKDQNKGLFSIWQEIFQLPQVQSNLSPSLITLHGHLQGLYENFLNMKLRDSSFSSVCLALEWLCLSDMLSRAMLHGQSFQLMRYLPFLPVAFHLLFAANSIPRLSYPSRQHEALTKLNHMQNLVVSMVSGITPSTRSRAGQQSLVLEVLCLLLDIIAPKLRPVNTQLYSTKEKQQLAALVSTMLAYNLTYHQERLPEGQYVYKLDPNVEDVCRFPDLPARKQLTYQAKQLIAHEIEMEKMRRTEAVLQARNLIEEPAGMGDVQMGSRGPAAPCNHQQRLEHIVRKAAVQDKPETDFFGRPILRQPSAPAPEAQPSERDAIENQMGKAVGRSDVWFRFNEGVSNAVRRNLYIRDLL